MRDWISKTIIIYCFFVFLFPFKAYGLDPRWLVFVIYITIDHKLNFNPFLVKYKIIRVIRYPLLMALFSVVGMIINGSPDSTFILLPSTDNIFTYSFILHIPNNTILSQKYKLLCNYKILYNMFDNSVYNRTDYVC